MKNPPPRPAIDPAEQNRAAARTLDDLARAARPVKPIEQTPAPLPTSPSAPLPPLDDSDRPHLWPAVGLKWHALAMLVTVSLMLLAYSNSVTSLVKWNDQYPDVGYTLDNKYIIQLDPRTKA